jgi:hypothetical protein
MVGTGVDVGTSGRVGIAVCAAAGTKRSDRLRKSSMMKIRTRRMGSLLMLALLYAREAEPDKKDAGQTILTCAFFMAMREDGVASYCLLAS